MAGISDLQMIGNMSPNSAADNEIAIFGI